MALRRIDLGAARPWSGVVIPPLAWLLCQQGAATLVYDACGSAGPPVGPLFGAVSAAVCVLAGWLSWSASRGADDSVRKLLRLGGTGIAALFALACLVLAASTLLVPPCAR
jgi:hypothetical protein